MTDASLKRSTMKARRLLRLLVVLPALALFCGCDAGDPNIGTVTGTITMDGTPLANALVEFVPTAGGGTSYGRTDASGNYEMEYSRGKAGASVGEMEVRITTGDVELDEDEREVRVPEKVPARYNVNTELKRTVESGSNSFDFELTSEGEIVDEVESDDDT